MKNFLLLLSTIFFLVSCNESTNDKSDSDHNSNAISETHDEEEFNATEVENDEDFEGVESKHVLFCRIGDYMEPAIMVLDWGERDENGIYPISGYYYYLKHGKNLDLEGYSEPSTRMIYLTESYKGKETGYMEFIQDDEEGVSFWAPNKNSKDRQEFYSEDVLFTDPLEMNLALDIRHYSDEHEVMMFDAEEEYWMAAKNEMHITLINEEFMAFKLYVVCTNGHSGEVDGLAQVKGNKAYFDNGLTDEWDQCDLEFDLSKADEISVIENNCKAYHGARAYFDATLYLEK